MYFYLSTGMFFLFSSEQHVCYSDLSRQDISKNTNYRFNRPYPLASPPSIDHPQPTPQLSPSTLTSAASNRVCNSLALMQCIAHHRETRPLFLRAHVPLLLYPFLNTGSRERPFEYLRLTSLGVIGALVKVYGCGCNIWV